MKENTLNQITNIDQVEEGQIDPSLNGKSNHLLPLTHVEIAPILQSSLDDTNLNQYYILNRIPSVKAHLRGRVSWFEFRPFWGPCP